MYETRFTVFGDARPKGNHGMIRTRGHWQIVEMTKGLDKWVREIKLKAHPGRPESPLETPIRLDVLFRFLRPKTVKRTLPTSRRVGDLDKLIRAVGDALTGIIYKDDSQIVELNASKVYADGVQPGVVITVRELPTDRKQGELFQ